MKTRNEVAGNSSGSVGVQSDEARGTSRSSWWRAVALLLAGIVVGGWLQGPSEPQLFAFDPQATYGNIDDSNFTFIPFRRNLWVIDHENDQIKFYMFPSSDERPIQPSREYKIDRTEFPADVVRFQVSDHNVTSFLWILNPETGHGRYLKALRDGKIEESVLLDVSKTD